MASTVEKSSITMFKHYSLIEASLYSIKETIIAFFTVQIALFDRSAKHIFNPLED